MSSRRIAPHDVRRNEDLILALLRDHGPATSRTIAMLIAGWSTYLAHRSFSGYGMGGGLLMDVRRRMASLDRRGLIVRAGQHPEDSRQVLWAPASVVTLDELPPLVTTGGRA